MNGGADPAAFAELVRETGAEVVAAQELAPEQADALARVLGHGQLDPRRDYRGMGIRLARPAALPRRARRAARPARLAAARRAARGAERAHGQRGHAAAPAGARGA